jgi:hypothetical protein
MAYFTDMQAVKTKIDEDLSVLEEIIHKLVNLKETNSRAVYAGLALIKIQGIKNKLNK